MHSRNRSLWDVLYRITLHTLLAIVIIIFGSSSALCAVVKEKREIVFEYATGKAMAEFEKRVLRALKVYGHVTDPFYRFHLPGNLILEYEENNVYPDGEVPLTFKYRPHDGPGYEFEDKNGIRFGVDFTVFDWEFSVGRNFEEDFPAPMYGDYLEFYDAQLEFWGKYVRCIGGFNLSLFSWEDLQGNPLNMTIHIIEPAGGELVYFEEKKEQPPSERDYYQVFQQYAAGTFQISTLKIAPTYVGKIRLEATIQNLNFVQKSGSLSPGIEVNYVKDWFCNHKYLYNTYDWYEIKDQLRAVPIDSAETEPLEWELESHPYHLVQNLIAIIQRQMTDEPVIGEPDTLITKIYNLHSGRCRFYSQISLDYYLDDGNGPILIGNHTLDTLGSPDPPLKNFNYGIIDTIEVKFAYDDTSPYWIFTKDRQWTFNDPNPRYICTMTADTATTGASCDNWVVNHEPLSFSADRIIDSRPGSNISIASFALPLPDFSVDSVGMQSPPYFQPPDEFHDPDTAYFDVTVTNRGTPWPPVEVYLEDPEDYVYLTGRAVYESFIPPDSFAEAYNDTFDYRLITPMDSDSSREYSFTYVIPSGIESLASLPIHRICFVFETNGGGIATNSTVWERNFNDNVFETYHFYTVYPDSALPSEQLYTDFESITPAMPDMTVYPPCSKPMYLYVADDEFTFSLPPTAPSNLTVEIGIGDWETSPHDSSWSWNICAHVKDHIDNNGNHWKVYEGDLCSFVLGKAGYYSYCFRASFNYSSAFPTFLYVDSDGASSVDGYDNHYYYHMAGLASLSSQVPGWRYSFKNLFQDNFPSDPVNIESFIRADMAYDINPPESVIRPGDSIVLYCVPPDTGAIDTTTAGEPMVYLHVKCSYIGAAPTKPSLAGPSLEGTYGTYDSDDGTWTIILGEPAVASDGSAAVDYYMFDLNDSLLTRGYIIEYYFKSFFNGGMSSTLPAHAETKGNYFEFTCLPTLASDILYVDDHHGLGSDDGIVQTYIDHSFRAVLLAENQPDRYDVNDPSSVVSNGLGSRAAPGHLIDIYSTIIWDSGSLPDGTICDGTSASDKSGDCQLLLAWLDGSTIDVGLWIMGDNVASDLVASGSVEALGLLSTCGVSLVNGNYYDLTGGSDGGVANPMINTVPTSWPNPMHEDQFVAIGEGDTVCSFDVLDATGGGQRALEYVHEGFPNYCCGIQTETDNTSGGHLKIMWFGSSLMHIRDPGLPDPGEAMARNRITAAVLGWMGHATNPDITPADVMPVYRLWQNYPNPFNPSTTIMFVMEKKGPVKLDVYNPAGQLVRTLVDEVRDAGVHRVVWDGMNNRGVTCTSGVYFYRIITGGVEQARKMVLLR